MIDWNEVYKIFLITGVVVASFFWGRYVGQDIADPHQCVSVCVKMFEEMGC